jgi:hypothetical protein
MGVVLPRAQRANLQLMADGKRVNWNNISILKVGTLETADGVSLEFRWKYKASIKTEITTWTGKNLELVKHFRPFNIVELLDNIFINLNRILFVEEKSIHGPTEKTSIRMVFEDGLEINETFLATKWAWWKTTFL